MTKSTKLKEERKFKFFVIHNKDPERRKVIIEQLLRNGVADTDIELIDYPNKEDLTYSLKKKIVQKKRDRHNFGFPSEKGSLKDGWICVSYKHYLAIEKIVKNKYPLGIIIEDNVGSINKNIIDTLNKCLDELPSDWDSLFDSTRAHSFDMMKEGKVTNKKIVYKKNLGYSFNKNGNIIGGGGTKSAQFYMLNFNSAKNLYENYLPFNHAPDVWMNELFRHLDFNAYWVEPSITENRKNHKSTTNFEKKLSYYQIKSKIHNLFLGI